MDKTFIEKRIKEKAEKRFDDDWDNLRKFLKNNKIASKLKLNIKNKLIFLVDDTHGSVKEELFTFDEESKILKDATNISEIKEELIKQYEKEETDNLIRKLESIEYLIHNS